MPILTHSRRLTAAASAAAAVICASVATSGGVPDTEPRIVAEREERGAGGTVLSWKDGGPDSIDGGAAVRFSLWRRASGDAPPPPDEGARLDSLYGASFTAALLEEGWRFAADLPARPVREYVVVLPAAGGGGGTVRVFAHSPADTTFPDPPPEPPDTSTTEPPDTSATDPPPEPPDTSGSPAPPDTTLPDPPFPAGEGPPPPATPELLPVQPNPFNPETTIRFLLPAAGPVRLTVHDARGRFVALLMERFHDGTAGEVLWDGRDDSGREAPSGIYLIRLETGPFRAVRRAVLLR